MRVIYIIIILLTVIITNANGQQVITLNYPPNKTVMEFYTVNISLTLPQGAVDSITVNANNRARMKIIPDSKIECFPVTLSLGVNRIIITAIKDSKTIDEIIVSVFRRSDLNSEYRKPPDGFQKNYFHMKERPLCAECHILKPGDSDRKPVNIAAFPDEGLTIDKNELAKSSTCYSCHKRLTSYPFVHVPSAVWSCLSCHDPVTDSKYEVRKPYTKICYSCHIKQKEERESKKYFHGPLTTGKCTICHNPHGSENPMNLHKSIWDLCISCHINNGSGRHIVKLFPGTNFHPTRGVPDPSRKGRELSCTSCHDPHSSASSKLWRFNVGSGFALCKKCHAN